MLMALHLLVNMAGGNSAFPAAPGNVGNPSNAILGELFGKNRSGVIKNVHSPIPDRSDADSQSQAGSTANLVNQAKTKSKEENDIA